MTARPRLAYLTGEYPAISHTFILREIEGLRARGCAVETCSIRRTDPSHHRGPAEQAAAASTFYVLAAAKNPMRLLAAQLSALKTPGRYLDAIRLAWRTRPPGLRNLAYQLFYFLEASVLAQHLRAQKIDHLHNHFGNSSCSVAMLTSALSGIPFSYTMHGPAIFFEPRHWRIDEKIARAAFVACISHFCRSQGMIFADPAHWHKLRIVHCAVHPENYAPAPDKTPGKRLLFVGRLAAVKGVLVLLEAFAQVLKTHPDAHLTLVGDGAERARIEAEAARLGVAGQIRFAGYLSQDEVARELAQADVFVLPSFAEGVPVVLMEAMASQLPVIATRIAGISELVEEGMSGHMVPPGDAQAFAGALEAVLGDAETRAQMGRAGRKTIEAEFNLAHETAWLETLFAGNAPAGALRPAAQDAP